MTKLISWNVNGIRAVSRKGFPDFFCEQAADIVCLQEIKIQEDQLNGELSFPDYQQYCSYAEKKGYSGVATLTHKNLPLKEKDIRFGLGVEEFDSEGRFVITPFKDFTLYNMYIPSGTTGELRQDFKYSFLDTLSTHLKALTPSERKKVILCGDFNICHQEIDIHHPETASKRELSGFLPAERAWIDRLCEMGFVDTFRLAQGEVSDSYTWWSYRAGARKKNLGWRIDYFFVASEMASKVKNAEILPQVEGSDHCPITLELDF
jgi:exodeoxyribonuclease-3